MGSLFLATWVAGFHAGTLRAQSGESPPKTTILPPSGPAQTPPGAPRLPVDGDDAFSPILKRRQERLDKVNAENAGGRKEPFTVARQVEKLKNEKADGKPSESFVSLTLAYVRVATAGPERKNYLAEMTSLFHWATRVGSNKNSDKAQLFAGFRMAPFTGSGSYQGVPGRYGFTYFGPMIGLGKIRPPEDEEPASDLPADEVPETAAGFRSGMLWAAGLALTSRYSETGSVRPKGEFENKSVLLDGTGLWTEFTYEALFFETMALRALVGLQTGKDKVFSYGGLGFGLWM